MDEKLKEPIYIKRKYIGNHKIYGSISALLNGFIGKKNDVMLISPYCDEELNKCDEKAYSLIRNQLKIRNIELIVIDVRKLYRSR